MHLEKWWHHWARGLFLPKAAVDATDRGCVSSQSKQRYCEIFPSDEIWWVMFENSRVLCWVLPCRCRTREGNVSATSFFFVLVVSRHCFVKRCNRKVNSRHWTHYCLPGTMTSILTAGEAGEFADYIGYPANALVLHRPWIWDEVAEVADSSMA